MNEHHTETNILRLTASFAVVLLHVSARRLSGEDWELLPCAVNGATRFAVPLFVMISGRYMLSAPVPSGGSCPRPIGRWELCCCGARCTCSMPSVRAGGPPGLAPSSSA